MQSRTDIILPMSRTPTEDYMQQIVSRTKTHEFRKRLYPASVVRIWFYETAPISALTYICEIHPAHRHHTDPPLPIEDGLGNREYNAEQRSAVWKGYDYAYRIKSCWRIRQPVRLEELKGRFGIKGAPRGMVWLPEGLGADVKWDEQELIWREDWEGDDGDEIVSSTALTAGELDEGVAST